MLKKLNSKYSFAAVALACIFIGCAGMMKNATRDAMPAVVSGTVEGLADPNTQRQMLAAIDEDRVKKMSALMSAGFVDGMLDTLEDPARRERLDAILNGITATAAGAAVDSMLEHALDEKVQVRMQLVMRETVTDFINTIFETVNSKMGSSEQLNTAIGAAVHDLAKQATLGFQEALDDTRRDRASGTMTKKEGALIIAANDASQTGGRILWTLGIGLSAVVLGLAITLIWAIRKNRMRRSELKERDDALSLLTEAIKSTATQPGAAEFHAALQTLIRDRRAGGDRIRKVLGVDKPE